eukprot:CAMPEP_0175449842 /NCGR_PEP_ID=MMETSP0095-20121207/62052_1 /TAXON_ID=311494 /ORGANISM="Alexandrium monilatum, Strain CCMP3105" /LENGTH=126 /DNA_ID=CAMNT_0016750275 /DNA_START=18 /DNA_END=396 /DNA_ORIENTATION=-
MPMTTQIHRAVPRQRAQVALHRSLLQCAYEGGWGGGETGRPRRRRTMLRASPAGGRPSPPAVAPRRPSQPAARDAGAALGTGAALLLPEQRRAGTPSGPGLREPSAGRDQGSDSAALFVYALALCA